MKNLFVKAFATAVFVAGTATQASAQLTGLPVYHMPKSVTGVTFNGDFGICASGCTDALDVDNNPSFVGARVGLGLPIVSFEIGLGSFNTDETGADKEITFAGKAAVQVFGGPLVPVSVSLQAGVGITKFGDLNTDLFELTLTTIPIGVGIGVNVPTPGASIEPWIAPRIQVSREKLTRAGLGSATETNTNVGISAGLNVGFASGLGLHLALDYLNVTGVDAAGVELPDPITFGIGLHYTFKLPGIGVPMVPGV